MTSTTVSDVLDERVTAFEASTTAERAIDAIRTSTAGSERTVYYAYVVADDGTLEGVASLRELLNADDDTAIRDVATESVVTVAVDDSIDDVGAVFGDHHFMALPVVNDDEELLGIVRANSVIEALGEGESPEALTEAVRDIEYDPGDESAYECFSCGTIITAVDNPGECPNCGDQLRNRQTPIE